MKTIWKYVLRAEDIQSLMVPSNRQVLSVEYQDHQAVLYIKVDPESPESPLIVYIHGTGHPIVYLEDSAKFVGTIMSDFDLVFHVFVESDNG